MPPLGAGLPSSRWTASTPSVIRRGVTTGTGISASIAQEHNSFCWRVNEDNREGSVSLAGSRASKSPPRNSTPRIVTESIFPSLSIDVRSSPNRSLYLAGYVKSIASSCVRASGSPVLLRLELRGPLPEQPSADLRPPGRRDLHKPLHVVVGQPGFDQLLHEGQGPLAEEPAHLVGDLMVERLGGDRHLFLLLGCVLLGLVVVLVAPARVPEAALRPH